LSEGPLTQDVDAKREGGGERERERKREPIVWRCLLEILDRRNVCPKFTFF
jgi:hypothetical protein